MFYDLFTLKKKCTTITNKREYQHKKMKKKRNFGLYFIVYTMKGMCTIFTNGFKLTGENERAMMTLQMYLEEVISYIHHHGWKKKKPSSNFVLKL